MNIFYLGLEPINAARFHVDKHITKMPIEATQMLCTVLREKGLLVQFGGLDQILYRSAFKNHVCTKWVGESQENFVWTISYAQALLREYTHRYGGEHKTQYTLDQIWDIITMVKPQLPKLPFTHPPKTVNTAYKHLEPVMAHRAQYYWVKKRLHNWTGRRVPFWIDNPPQEILDAGPPIHK